MIEWKSPNKPLPENYIDLLILKEEYSHITDEIDFEIALNIIETGVINWKLNK